MSDDLPAALAALAGTGRIRVPRAAWELRALAVVEQALAQRERSVQVDRETSALMLVFAGRYGLGRRSAGVAEIAGWLVAYRDHLADWQRIQIVEDIEAAIAGGFAGDACDVEDWRRVAEALR